MVRMYATAWYVGTNARGGSSLYQVRLNGGAPQAQEITDGVTDMQITYKVGSTGNFGDAPASTAHDQWKAVTAVNVVLTVQAASGALTSNDTKGTGNVALTRTLSDVVTLRNHVDVQ